MFLIKAWNRESTPQIVPWVLGEAPAVSVQPFSVFLTTPGVPPRLLTDLQLPAWTVAFFFKATPHLWGFPCGSDRKEPACNAGDLGAIPGSERSPGEGNGTHSSILTLSHNRVTHTFPLSPPSHILPGLGCFPLDGLQVQNSPPSWQQGPDHVT